MIASFGGNSSNGCRGVTVSLATLVALLGASTPQSTVPIVQLRVPDAMLSEPFSEVAGIRELSDGRVLVVDALELKVWKVDLSKDSRIPIGRNGRGPGEYEWPIRLFAFPNDETAIVDDASRTIQFFSVPIGDGGNPSPLGEEKVRVTWSRATLPVRSAHENGPEGPHRVYPQVPKAGAHRGGGDSCARRDSAHRRGT